MRRKTRPSKAMLAVGIFSLGLVNPAILAQADSGGCHSLHGPLGSPGHPGFWEGWGFGHTDAKVEGFVDVPPAGPGGSLTLPLPSGSPPVTVIISFGLPAVQVPITITPRTCVEAAGGLPVTVTDGQRVRVEARVVESVVEASEVEIDEFPELRLRGLAQDLPAGGVRVPLPPGSTLDFTFVLGTSGVSIPVRLTSSTRVRGDSFLLTNGAAIDIEALVRDGRIVITRLKRGHE